MSTQMMMPSKYQASFTLPVRAEPTILSAIQEPANPATATVTPLASQPRLMFSLRVEMTAGTATGHLNRLMSDCRYAEAATLGQKVQAAFTDQPARRLDQAEFDVIYALALIYTGAQSEGIALLQKLINDWEAGRQSDEATKQGDPKSFEGKRRNYVLGRAHNNLGYAYEQQTLYWDALCELGSALSYFQASESWEELANTYDNMGRVWAMLGSQNMGQVWVTLLSCRDRAESYIQRGLELRRKLNCDERTCLSLISYANFHLIFEEPNQAHHLALEAFSMVRRSSNKRHIGLACIALGRSLRQLAALPRAYLRQKRLELLEQAQKHLMLAKGIFENNVDEPVRRIEVYKELGCTYRDLAALLHCDNLYLRPAGFAAQYTRRAESYLQDAIRLADGKYPALYEDACQAQAELQAQSQELADNRPGYGAPSNWSGSAPVSSIEFLGQAPTTGWGGHNS